MVSHYEVLHVERDASVVEIKQAFCLLARRWHPDKQGQRPDGVSEEEATQRFQRIQTAYEVLSDKSRRYKYDHQLGESVGEAVAAQARYAGDKRARPAHMHLYGVDLRWFEKEGVRWYEDRAREHKQWMEALQRRQEQMLREAAREHEQFIRVHTRKGTRRGTQQTPKRPSCQERAALHWDKFKDMYPQWRSMAVGERMQAASASCSACSRFSPSQREVDSTSLLRSHSFHAWPLTNVVACLHSVCGGLLVCPCLLL